MAGPKRPEMLQKHGHAGGHLRDGLGEALEFGDEWWRHIEIDFYRGRHNRWCERLSHAKRAHWLLGQLWNCTDILPGIMHDEIESRNEFGQAHAYKWGVLARLLARELKEEQTAGAR